MEHHHPAKGGGQHNIERMREAGEAALSTLGLNPDDIVLEEPGDMENPHK
jgi:hypothetical protein